MNGYRNLKVIIGFISMLALYSCGPGSDDYNFITVNLSDVNRKRVVKLSRWVAEPEFIALDSSCKEAYAEGRYCCISDNYIGLYGSEQVFKLYDRSTGQYLRNIGNVGKDSGEYTNVYSSKIDEENSIVYILSWNAKELLCHDLNTGKLIEARPLKHSVPKGTFSVDSQTGELTVATLPFKGMIEAVAWKQDRGNNILWEVPADNLSVIPDFSNEMNSCFNTECHDLSIVTWGGRIDSLYVIKDGGLKPIFTMNFVKDNVRTSSLPNHTYNLLPKHIVTSVSMRVRRSSGYPGYSKPIFVVTERKKEKSYLAVFTDDMLDRKLDYLLFKQGYYQELMSAEAFIKIGKHALSNGRLSETSKAKLSSILKNLTPESNDVIVLARLK